MEHKRGCFVPGCEINELSSENPRKNLHPFLIDVNDIESSIIGVGSPQLMNNLSNNNTRICEQYFLCTDHLNFFNTVKDAEVDEEAKSQDDEEEDSSNRLSQQLSTLSVSKVSQAPENAYDDLDAVEFIEIIESQNSKEFNELIDSLEELSQKKNQQKNPENICRICGSKSSETFPIFPDEKPEKNSKEMSLIDKLTLYLPVKLENNDDLPKVICSKCNGLVNQTHELAITSLMTASRLTGKIPGEIDSSGEIEPLNILKEIKKTRKGEDDGTDEESSSQDTLTALLPVKPLISSLITDDEDVISLVTIEDLERKQKKRPLSQEAVDGARPLKMRRVEPSFEKRFECNWCSISYTDEEQMVFHKNRHRLKKPILFWCNFCHFEFIKKDRLMKHIRSCHREEYQLFSDCYECKKCSQVFSFKSYAELHFISECGKHPMKDYKSEKYIEDLLVKYMYTCEYCYKGFASITCLHEHRNKYHYVDDSCKNCDKHQVNQKVVDLEEMNTFGIKNTFVCKYCTKTFIHFNSLMYHHLEHSDKKFHCSMCNEKFCTWANAKDHRENEHFYQIIYREKTAKLCVCFCGQEFHNGEEFMIHEKSHFIGTTLYEVFDDKTIAQPIIYKSSLDNSLGTLLEDLVNSPNNSFRLDD